MSVSNVSSEEICFSSQSAMTGRSSMPAARALMSAT
jgi:hypothetical protein